LPREGEPAGGGPRGGRAGSGPPADGVRTARVSEGRMLGGRFVWAATDARDLVGDVLRELEAGDPVGPPARPRDAAPPARVDTPSG
jgi:hypothetical protein